MVNGVATDVVKSAEARVSTSQLCPTLTTPGMVLLESTYTRPVVGGVVVRVSSSDSSLIIVAVRCEGLLLSEGCTRRPE